MKKKNNMGRPKKEPTVEDKEKFRQESKNIDETQYINSADIQDLVRPDYFLTLKTFLEALQVINIEKLLEENNLDTYKALGDYLLKTSKLGAPLLKDY